MAGTVSRSCYRLRVCTSVVTTTAARTKTTTMANASKDPIALISVRPPSSSTLNHQGRSPAANRIGGHYCALPSHRGRCRARCCNAQAVTAFPGRFLSFYTTRVMSVGLPHRKLLPVFSQLRTLRLGPPLPTSAKSGHLTSGRRTPANRPAPILTYSNYQDSNNYDNQQSDHFSG